MVMYIISIYIFFSLFFFFSHFRVGGAIEMIDSLLIFIQYGKIKRYKTYFHESRIETEVNTVEIR